MAQQKELNIGDCVIAQNKAYSSCGKITNIEMSSGRRHELIYKVDINWFFADEIKVDYISMIQSKLDSIGGIRPIKNYKPVLEFTHNKTKHTLSALVSAKEKELVYAVTNNGDLICLTYLRRSQLKKIYKHLCGVQNAKIKFESGLTT